MPYKDPEKRRAAQRAWYSRNKEKANASSRKWLQANAEKVRARQDAWRAANPGKVRARQRRWRIKNPDKVRAKAAQWRANNPHKLLAYSQARNDRTPLAGRPKPERCEVCGRLPCKRGIVFDHCHAKGHFRGWLCSRCNMALGAVDDDPKILRKLIAYLERTRDSVEVQLSLPSL